MDWGCFANLPGGITQNDFPPLSFGWFVENKPPDRHGLTDHELDAGRAAVNRSVANLAAAATLLFVSLGLAATWPAPSNSASESVIVLAVAFAGGALLVYLLSSQAARAFDVAEPRRALYKTELARFDTLAQWREERCEKTFWQRESISAKQFELECAELMAGMFRTDHVTLTRDKNDYGADALLCKAPVGRVVAQCKHWKGKVGAAEVRELAGSVQFFNAQLGILFCLHKPDDETEQWRAFAERFHLAYWDLECVLAMAKHLHHGSHPTMSRDGLEGFIPQDTRLLEGEGSQLP